MKILAICSFYPPHVVGGYEIGCHAVLEGLQARGHEVHVLTSFHGLRGPESSDGVFRVLQVDPFQQKNPILRLFELFRKERANRSLLRKLCEQLRPDVVYVWNLGGTSLSLLRILHELKIKTVICIADYWLRDWKYDRWFRLLSRIGLPVGSTWRTSFAPACVHYASDFIRRKTIETVPRADGPVVHWGIDEGRFEYRKESRVPRKLLFVGQLVRHKGVHTVIEATAELIHRHGFRDLSLSLVGGSTDATYVAEMRARTEKFGISQNVRFLGPKPRNELPWIYQEHDIFVFPSVWDEPLGMTYLEAMASGMAVVGTAAGGSAEAFQDRVNSLVFERENPRDCAEKILRLLQEPGLLEKLRQGGRKTVESEFSFRKMLDGSEAELCRASETGND